MNESRLLALRPRFPILRTTRYLVSHSLGAMPASTAEAMQEFASTWAARGVRAWEEGWWMMSLEVGDLVAPFLGAA
ncbi:MAG TPA: kynureninase, partial [Thermoanaerobaculia bacterium]